MKALVATFKAAADKFLERALRAKDPDVVQWALGKLNMIHNILSKLAQQVKTAAIGNPRNEEGDLKRLKAKALALHKKIVALAEKLS